MPFPDLGDYIVGVPAAIGGRPAKGGECPVSGTNVTRSEHALCCTLVDVPESGVRKRCEVCWTTNNLLQKNFLYIDRIDHGVAAGVLEVCKVGQHVYSDHFGGCEFHVLGKKGGGGAAFLHVYKGADGVAANYTLRDDWALKATIPTAGMLDPKAPKVSLVAYAFVAAGCKMAECCVLSLDPTGMVVRVSKSQDVDLG